MVAVRKCHRSLSRMFDNCIKLWIDIHGQLQYEQCHQKEEEHELLANATDVGPDAIPKGITGVDPSPSSKIPKSSTEAKENDDIETTQTLVDFSTVHELNWDKNKRNWNAILEETAQSPEDVITACDIWKPRFPMQITPERDSLKHMFISDAECEETIRKLETNTPGFGIASRSWACLLPELRIQRPPNHICDILTIAKSEGL